MKNRMTINEVPEGEREGRCKPLLKKPHVIVIGLVLLACVVVAIYFLARKSDVKAAGDDQLVPPDTEYELPPSPSHYHTFKRGAVCTDGPPCSAIGRDILAKNGSAVDATIAAMFCNGIVNSQSMGLGGGFLMTIYKRDTKTAFTLIARETAPAKAYSTMFQNDSMKSLFGPLSIGVPGELRGYWAAHQRFGRLPWKELLEPSLELCKTGYNMSKAQVESINNINATKEDPNLREVFFDESTGKLKPGNSLIIPSKKLCQTLSIIAEKGGDELYNGSLSETFANDLQELGSIITKKDLEDYKVKWDKPISVEINQASDKLYSVPPPGSGAILAFILKVLSGFNFNEKSIDGVDNMSLTYHRIIEGFKYAFAKRTLLGDNDFVDTQTLIANLTSSEYAESIRKQINDNHTYNDSSHYGAHFYNQPDHGTAHVSVLSPEGDAVSVTSTINFYFGSGLVTKNTGIILNNVMNDFSSPPGVNSLFGLPGSPANEIAPKKRPLSSMSPTVITDKNGDVKMVIGASGGTKITTSVALVIMRHLWFKQTIKQAVDAPRIHHQIIPMEIGYEYGNQRQIIENLQAKGHKTNRYRDRGSIICALSKNATAIYANSDYRKGGDVYGID